MIVPRCSLHITNGPRYRHESQRPIDLHTRYSHIHHPGATPGRRRHHAASDAPGPDRGNGFLPRRAYHSVRQLGYFGREHRLNVSRLEKTRITQARTFFQKKIWCIFIYQ